MEREGIGEGSKYCNLLIYQVDKELNQYTVVCNPQITK